jgi:hypothetical protein
MGPDAGSAAPQDHACSVGRPGAAALGPGRDARRFLATLALELRVLRLADYVDERERLAAMDWADRLVGALRADRHAARLDPLHESLLETVPLLAGDPRGAGRLPEAAMSLGPPFPWLRPVAHPTRSGWQHVREVLLVAAGVRHGEQLGLRAIAQKLRVRFADAPLDVVTARPELWRGLAGIRTTLPHRPEDGLAPFLLARAWGASRADRLIVFADGLRSQLYRNLEAVPGFGRFVFLDLGAREARLVDQRRGTVLARRAPRRDSLHAEVGELLDGLGLGGGPAAPTETAAPVPSGVVVIEAGASLARWRYDAAWMGAVTAELARRLPLELLLGPGAAPGDASFAAAILAGAGGARPRLLGGLDEALAVLGPGALVIGTDGLLTQLGTSAPILTVTVAPYLPVAAQPLGCSHLAVPGGRSPGAVARLVARWFTPSAPGARRRAAAAARAADRLAALAGARAASVGDMAAAARALRAAVQAWARLDSMLAEDFADSLPGSLSWIEALERARPARRASGPLRALVRRGCWSWERGNLGRYARWTAAAAAQARSVSR